MKKKSTIAELKQEGLVKNASDLMYMGNSTMKVEMSHVSLGKATWISDIEVYCGELGILPTDLIETHRQSLKMAAKKLKQGKNDTISEKQPRSNWFKDYKKAKTGISE